MAADVDVLVIGGGISGLAAAFGLQQHGCTVELLEAEARVGGVIGSRRRDGVLYELGPNSTLDTTPLVNELLDAAGLRAERLDANAEASIRYVVRDGRPVALPTSPAAFLTTSAFTLGAKLRLVGELFVAPTPPGVEESIAAFVRRRLGDEFLDYAIDPFVSGIYAGDPERISVPAAFPRLLALEQKYGGLIKGQIRGARERKKSKEVAKNTAKSFSFREGMQTLTDGVGRRLRAVRCGVRVQRIARDAAGLFQVEGEVGGAPFARSARAVVVATPAYAAAGLIRDLAPDAAQALCRHRVRADRGRRGRVPARRRRALLRRLRVPGAEEGTPQGAGLAVLDQHVRQPRPRRHRPADHVRGRPARSRSRRDERRGGGSAGPG